VWRNLNLTTHLWLTTNFHVRRYLFFCLKSGYWESALLLVPNCFLFSYFAHVRIWNFTSDSITSGSGSFGASHGRIMTSTILPRKTKAISWNYNKSNCKLKLVWDYVQGYHATPRLSILSVICIKCGSQFLRIASYMFAEVSSFQN